MSAGLFQESRAVIGKISRALGKMVQCGGLKTRLGV